MNFHEILDKYRGRAFSERDKGTRFERLCRAYLLTEPAYKAQLAEVWLWEDFPFRKDLGGKDLGIDLVGLTYDSEYWAIQCKFYEDRAVIDKPAVDSFISASSRVFMGPEGKSVPFSLRLWIATTNHWNVNAEEAIQNQSPEFKRISLSDLEASELDWAKLDAGFYGEAAAPGPKSARAHQQEAIAKTLEYFRHHDRGKLIMACGTGKTFTALRIAEELAVAEGGTPSLVLVLVPSIALIGQTLRAWAADAGVPLHAICVCSDPKISQKYQNENDPSFDTSVDLPWPATTDIAHVVNQLFLYKDKPGLTVVFSTYQSIDIVSQAQREILGANSAEFGIFDLIICDEAHRTTGVTLADETDSAFVRVHDNDFIKARKRLYMTATPRLYSEDSKAKARNALATLCSMDDPALYGEEIYRLGFGAAVEQGLLSDYKVLIFTMSEAGIAPAVQEAIADVSNEIQMDIASKLIGCVNALSKQVIGDQGLTYAADAGIMRRALAFCQQINSTDKITGSKEIARLFGTYGKSYLDSLPRRSTEDLPGKDSMARTIAQHIDGTMNAPARANLLTWLKAEASENECRILTNVRCLSEGVDVPSLDAVIFLSPRNSQIDVVQSVGRVMRTAPCKKYGYIIIPIIVRSDIDPVLALDDNEQYKVVWSVLNALRAHDDRFNATVNQIELNRRKPVNINIVASKVAYDKNGEPIAANAGDSKPDEAAQQRQLYFKFEQLQNVIYARLVDKVGDRTYWEQWAKRVSVIAEMEIARISKLVSSDTAPPDEYGDLLAAGTLGSERPSPKSAFQSFLKDLRKNINPSLNESEAIEMLAQHLITQPVFDALFEGATFAKHNPVSKAINSMLELLADENFEKDTRELKRFYDAVKNQVIGLDNGPAKQTIMTRLYESFFKIAFPKLSNKLGIVYTPVEVVDFIIHSVNAILKQEFNRGLTSENVTILDPFVGTGTFIVRLLQSGLIEPKDWHRKYTTELFANEIVLLAYYIAAVNIENAYHASQPHNPPPAASFNSPPLGGARGGSPLHKHSRTFVDSSNIVDSSTPYTPFPGICFTDTFQQYEPEQAYSPGELQFLEKNDERRETEKNTQLTVILGNPPYSIGQGSANDNAQNQHYPHLEKAIEKTYVANSKAGLNKAAYDSYIKAFRWASDRIGNNDGVIAFITNAGWLDSNSMDGFRQCLEKDFYAIYIFDLRGNQRTSGELSRREGGKIFGSGSRAPIAISLLIKKADFKGKATIYYRDIGDYLTREQKLALVKKLGNVANPEMEWTILTPNEHNDWIHQRNDAFAALIPLAPDKKFDKTAQSFFTTIAIGVATNRDAWVYNFSKKIIESNMKNMIAFYNEQRVAFAEAKKENPALIAKNFVNNDLSKISWTVNLWQDVDRNMEHTFTNDKYVLVLYRSFTKQWLYFDKPFIERPGIWGQLFPTPKHKNLVICVKGASGTKDFSCIITDILTDLSTVGSSQCFPLYYYEEEPSQYILDEVRYTRRDAVSDWILARARDLYGPSVTKEDLFYYTYGLLHSPHYREKFANDLKKMLPRIPLVDTPADFWAFVAAGRRLGALHLNYESLPPCPGVTVTLDGNQLATNPLPTPYQSYSNAAFALSKMRFLAKDRRDTIIYNPRITVSGIPAQAYDYVVNGKSAIEWIMERYAVRTDKASGICNNPNAWLADCGNPRYALDLLLSVINLSVQTVDIVAGLPVPSGI